MGRNLLLLPREENVGLHLLSVVVETRGRFLESLKS